MISLALSTVRGRISAFTGALIALLCSAILVSAAAYLAESGLRSTTQAQRYANVDAVVVGDQTMRIPGSDMLSSVRLPETVRVPQTVVEQVEALPEVGSAVVDDRVTMRVTGKAAGASASSDGIEARRWSTASLGGFHVTEGREPQADHELELTTDEARSRHLALGDVITASVNGVPQDYSIVGLVAIDTAQDVPTAFLTEAQMDSLLEDSSTHDALLLSAADSVSVTQMETAVSGMLSDGFVVGTGQRVADAEHREVAEGQSLLLLLATSFGGMAVLISFFVIASTMGLVLGSRRREFATFRTLGATPWQLISMVFTEVSLLSLVAGAIGAPLGIWVASLLRSAFVAMGVVPSSLQLVVTPWAGAAAVALIVLCALAASWAVTYGAAFMSPVSALQDAAPSRRPVGGWRPVAAGVTLILGAMTTTVPLFLHDDIGAAGTSSAALVLVVAVAMAGPYLLGPMVRVISAPIRRMGASGFLAAESSRADVRRMGAVVTPLVLAVGFTLAMVYSQATLARAVSTQVERGVVADVVVVGSGGDPIDSQVSSAVQNAPETDSVVGVSDSKIFVPVTLLEDVEVAELSTSILSGQDIDKVLDPDVVEGSLSDLKGETIALDRSTSTTLRRGVGDVVEARLGDGTSAQFRVVALYERGLGLGQALLPQSAVQGHVSPPTRLLASAAEGLSQEDAATGVSASLASYPAMTTTDSSGFAASARAEATMAAWVNLLGLLVIMSYLIIAVVNSLVVATHVRRREIALLRLVGVTRAQLLRAMRWEVLMTIVCAVLLGTVVGGLPLVVQSIGFLGSVIPAGSPLIYVAIVVGAVLVSVPSVMLPVRLVLRRNPVSLIGQRE